MQNNVTGNKNILLIIVIIVNEKNIFKKADMVMIKVSIECAINARKYIVNVPCLPFGLNQH